MSTDRKQLLVVFGLVVALAAVPFGVSGCAESESSRQSVDEAAAQKTGAEKIAEERCSRCHTAVRALAWRTSSVSEATRLIDEMARGTSLTAEERTALIEYFTR